MMFNAYKPIVINLPDGDQIKSTHTIEEQQFVVENSWLDYGLRLSRAAASESGGLCSLLWRVMCPVT